MYFISSRRSSIASKEQTQASLLEFDPSSTNFDQKNIRPSMLYNVLPTVVQSRLPTLPSIRQSISDIRGRAFHVKSTSTDSSDTEFAAPETPPPTYCSRRSSDGRSRVSILSNETEEIEFRDDASERPTSSMSTPPPFAVSETVTGINWKYANQGTAGVHVVRSIVVCR